MFSYCGNNPIDNTDPNGMKYLEDHPIEVNQKGFQIEMSSDFLDPSYCLYYAYEIVFEYGDKSTFLGMDAERIALEIYAHAVLYFFGDSLKNHLGSCVSGATFNSDTSLPVFIDCSMLAEPLIDLSYYFSNYLCDHGAPIDVNNDEYFYRLLIYQTLWDSALSGTQKAEIKKQFLYDWCLNTLKHFWGE